MTCFITKDKTCNSWATICISNRQLHTFSRKKIKQDRHFCTKANVLCTFSDIKTNRGLSFPGIGTVNQCNRVFHFQPTQVPGHGSILKHGKRKKTRSCDLIGRFTFQFGLRLSFQNSKTRPRINRPSLRTGNI